LNKTFNKAHLVGINKESKIIFFSDLHKGDNSYADDFKHNMKIYEYALHDYFKKEFTYIEIGDGIELWENKSFAPIYQAHKSSFNLLKLFNEHWIRPMNEERPENSNLIENGCYW